MQNKNILKIISLCNSDILVFDVMANRQESWLQRKMIVVLEGLLWHSTFVNIILQVRSYWFHVADDAMETIMFPKFYFMFDSIPAEVMALR